MLDGGKLDAEITFQIGSSASETLTFDASGQIGGIDITTLDALSDQSASNGEISALNTFIDAVGAARSKFGATINRLDHTINNLESVSQNTQAAYGRIMDADFAGESANMTKQQMLMQSGISVLAKSNQMTGMVASLLQ